MKLSEKKGMANSEIQALFWIKNSLYLGLFWLNWEGKNVSLEPEKIYQPLSLNILQVIRVKEEEYPYL